jgi:hypothetical protein
LERRLGLFRRHTRLESADGEEVVVGARFEPSAAGFDLPRHHQRNPHFGRVSNFSPDEPFGRDADDRERAAVERDLAVDDRRVCAEATLPRGVAQHGDGVRPRSPILFGQEAAAERGAHAEHVEVVARRQVAPDALVVAAAAQAHRREAVGEQPREDLAAVAVVLVVEVRLDRHVRAVVERAEEFVKLTGSLDGQRAQQHRVHETEDRGVGPDAERERHGRNEREARTLPQPARAVSQVLQQLSHHTSE